MIAAAARQMVRNLGAGDAVAKIVADAPELTNLQRDTLHAILLSPDAETASPNKLARHHHRP
jgi:hypothetical protein